MEDPSLLNPDAEKLLEAPTSLLGVEADSVLVLLAEDGMADSSNEDEEIDWIAEDEEGVSEGMVDGGEDGDGDGDGSTVAEGDKDGDGESLADGDGDGDGEDATSEVVEIDDWVSPDEGTGSDVVDLIAINIDLPIVDA